MILKKIMVLFMMLLLLVSCVLAEASDNPPASPLDILQAYLSGDPNITVEQAQEAVSLLRSMFEQQPDSLSTLKAGASGEQTGKELTYVLNVRSNRFHQPDCVGVKEMAAKNRLDYFGTRDLLIATGFKPCGHCKP